MSDKGWIKISRSINNHWIWKDSVKFKWWMDILLMANYENKKLLIGYKVFECKRGECLMSLKSWGERWGVSKTVVNNFFAMLENDNMIKTVNETVTTRLIICNYESYQQKENESKTDLKRKKNATETEQSTTKESKESKEYKNILLSEIIISDFPDLKIEYYNVAISFQHLIRKNLIEFGASTKDIDSTKGIAIDEIRLLVEKDNHSIESLRKVFVFLESEIPKGEFSWKKNILSIKTLRKQFNKLLIESNNKKNGTGIFSKGATQQELAEIIARKFGNNSQ